MSNKTQIVMHVMPHEIDQYNECIQRLIQTLGQIEYPYHQQHDEIELYTTLNLSPQLTDWDKSSIKADEVQNEFNAVNRQIYSVGKISVNFEVIRDNSILGTTAQKRKAIRTADESIKDFIFLDSDIYFHWSTLKYLLEATKYINNKYYIITPQTIKLWDETWDVITHKDFLQYPYGFEKTYDPHGVFDQYWNDASIAEVPTFKFGCGWFTLYSKSLWQFVDIPDALGGYGSEDTYLMFASAMMQQMGYDVQQYMIEGLFIAEDYKYRPNKYKNNIVRRETKEENYVKHNTPKFAEAMQAFQKKLLDIK